MSDENVGQKMTRAFGTVSRIYAETALLMQTIEGLMQPEFTCPFGGTAVWDHSHAYDAGRGWLVSRVSRCWEKRDDNLKALLVDINFTPELDVGPLVTAMALRLAKPVKSNDWKYWWCSSCGREADAFEIDDSRAPFYHSEVKATCERDGADRLESIDNFWLPLSELTGRECVNGLLVSPLKEIFDKGPAALEHEKDPYLRIRSGQLEP